MKAEAEASLLAKVDAARAWLGERVIGQETLLERLMIALITGGHLLVEGPPGLAKTRAIKELAEVVDGSFHRIQFTPDLLPADVTGTDIFHADTGRFSFQQGPIFNNLVLADEINRAPAKVQSALLEGMAEHQVSIGRQTYQLPELFLVMATQNPIEQEGTYPLPEAQLDRFLLHVTVDYPSAEAERRVLSLVRREAVTSEPVTPTAGLSQDDVFQIRRTLTGMHMAGPVEEYIVQLIQGTRRPADYSADLASWLEYGASPRGTIALDLCARAHAWLQGRDFVAPDNVQAIAHDVLRHRLILSYEAEAEAVRADQVIDTLLSLVPAP